MAKPKEHVKKHLEKSHVDPGALPDNIIETLNKFTDDELNEMFRLAGKHGLADQLEEANLSPKLTVCATH
jgi:hypothetical protein